MELLSTSITMSSALEFRLKLQELELLDQKTISSNDSVGRTRSVLNLGPGNSVSSAEVSNGDEEEYSGGESDLVQTDSRVVRQLQPPETEEDKSLREDFEVFLLVVCLDDDFLGGSGEIVVLVKCR